MKHYFLLLVLLVAGCGSGEFQITNVSGTVTFDDEPLVGAEVVFAPMGEADAIDVGPVSVGTTDAEGRYSLTTIRGQKGAVVTKHRVSVGLKDISRSEVARRLDEEYAKKPRMSEGEFLALERKIRQSMRKELWTSEIDPRERLWPTGEITNQFLASSLHQIVRVLGCTASASAVGH